MKHVLRLGITLALVIALQACVQRRNDQTASSPLAPAAVAAERDSTAPTKYALLVGCTKYDNRDIPSLEGPANDVVLMRDVLKQYYDLKDKDIVVLSEEAGKERGVQHRPTRANIEREFAELARKAKKGDKVVILLAGHGSQQPDSRPDDPERFEPDGKEEIFLPADTGQWDGAARVKNAIVDYEFAAWLKAIRKTEASVWVIVDACHSASMIRGTEVPREVAADKLVPKEVLRKAEEKARQRQTENQRGPAKKAPSFHLPKEPDLVVIYAAQSTEPTVELTLPDEGTARKSQGLLTYTLCKTLIEASKAKSPLTYQELLQRIHDQYKAWGRSYPTPLIEGKDRKRFIFGEEVSKERAARSLIHLDQDKDRNWFVDAGSLHGLTVGSILKVFPPSGAVDSEKPVGHVEILENGFSPLRARVKACEFAGLQVSKELPNRGRCEVVFTNYRDQHLTVAVDGRTNKGELVPEDRRRPLLDVLTKLAEGENSLVGIAPSPMAAQWLLRFDSLASDKLYLVPGSGWRLPAQQESAPQEAALSRLPALFGPVPNGEGRLGWLKDSLSNISRVRNLIGVADLTQSFQGRSDLDVKVRMELVRRRNKGDNKGVPIKGSLEGISLYDGDSVGIRMFNEGRNPVDVTLLLVNNQFGIDSVFPEQAGTDNRIQPGQHVFIGMTASASTSGLERLLLIAVDAKNVSEFAYFGFLAQRSIEKASREVKGTPRGARERGFDSPMGQLFRKAVYGEGKAKRRGLKKDELAEYAFQILPYDMIPAKRPADAK